MILLLGLESDPPLAGVAQELIQDRVPHLIVSQRSFADLAVGVEVEAGNVGGWLRVGRRTVALESVRGVYARLVDFRDLPEFRAISNDTPGRWACQKLHELLSTWCDLAPCRVVNRPSAMGSNASKPYQSQLIRDVGFAIPETLITNDPALVYEFRSRFRAVIFKSMSGVRSIVGRLDDQTLARIDRIRWCPTQFQEYVPGTNVRVHVVGDDVFATAIHSEAIDYRYAKSQVGMPADLFPTTLPSDLSNRCIQLARCLGLEFAGVDLKFAPDGRIVCFEVNPSPAYSFYEAHTGQPIAAAVSKLLVSSKLPIIEVRH